MHTFMKALRRRLDEDSSVMERDVLEILYECYDELHPYDNDQIKTDFRALYAAMNGMPLREMDNIVYPVCTLCRDHERSGFVDGVKIGVRLAQELKTE